jgi:hypothetical protein
VTHGERQALYTIENRQFQDIYVNRTSTPFHKDANRKFLTSLIFLKKYKSLTSVHIVVSCIVPQRTKRGLYMKKILRMMRTMCWCLEPLGSKIKVTQFISMT